MFIVLLLKFYFKSPSAPYLPSLSKAWRPNLHHHENFYQNWTYEISLFFRFLRWPRSTILDFQTFKLSNFLVADWVEWLMCIAIMGQTVAEISHLTIFKIASVRHLGCLKVWFFDQLVRSGGVIYVIMQNFVKIGKTV